MTEFVVIIHPMNRTNPGFPVSIGRLDGGSTMSIYTFDICKDATEQKRVAHDMANFMGVDIWQQNIFGEFDKETYCRIGVDIP